VDYVLAVGVAWVGGSLLAALGWSRFFRGMDTLPDHADSTLIPVRTETNWEAEYQRALATEVIEERMAAGKSA
jgi:hypothetical protein